MKTEKEINVLKHSEPNYKKITSLAFSPIKNIVASVHTSENSSEPLLTSTIRVWNAESGVLLHELKDLGAIAVIFSPDGKIIVSGSHDGTIRLWDVQTGTLSAELHGRLDPVKAVAFSPNGNLLASGDIYGIIKLWDMQKREEIKTLPEQPGEVTSLVFSPDGQMLASGS